VPAVNKLFFSYLLLLCSLASGSLCAKQIVSRLLRQFSAVPGVNFRATAMSQDAGGRVWIASEDGVGNGRAGIDQALATIPDVDGYTLVETLKQDERTSHIPILMLTAKSSFDSRMPGLYAGADDYLSKPFSFAELHTRIRNVLLTRRHWQHHLTASQPPEAFHASTGFRSKYVW